MGRYEKALREVERLDKAQEASENLLRRFLQLADEAEDILNEIDGKEPDVTITDAKKKNSSTRPSGED
jgi:hypothetical protein